jgi:hypothetical protein
MRDQCMITGATTTVVPSWATAACIVGINAGIVFTVLAPIEERLYRSNERMCVSDATQGFIRVLSELELGKNSGRQLWRPEHFQENKQSQFLQRHKKDLTHRRAIRGNSAPFRGFSG